MCSVLINISSNGTIDHALTKSDLLFIIIVNYSLSTIAISSVNNHVLLNPVCITYTYIIMDSYVPYILAYKPTSHISRLPTFKL